MGHEVYLFAKAGSQTPSNGKLFLVKGTTEGQMDKNIEVWIERKYHEIFMDVDIIHDCSLDHIIAERLYNLYGKTNIVNTINGRTYYMPRPPFNVVTGSKYWQKEAKEMGNLNTEMIYWGVDTNFYTPGSAQEDQEDYYFWVSRFHPVKGLDIALDLAEYLGFKLKVAGSMEFRDHAEYGKKYLERIGQLSNVEYIQLPMNSTHHEVKRELYRRAKAFLYPVQYPESFGLVVMEALACGTPVITTDQGAMPELVKHGVSGFVCEKKRDFTLSIESLNILNIEWVRERCRENALYFDWKVAAQDYEKLYEKVLNGYFWR